MALGKNAFSLFISNGLHAASHVVILVICSRLLTEYEYGSYRQFFTIYEIAVPLLGLGLSQSIFYFFARTSSRRNVITQVFYILLITGLVFTILILCFGKFFAINVFHSEILSECLLLIVPFTVFSLIVPVLSAVYVDAGRSKILALYSSAYVFLLACSASLVAYYTRDVFFVVSFRAVAVLAFVLILYGTIRRNRYLDEKLNLGNSVEVFSAADILKYSVPLGLASAAGMLSQQVDKIIVSTATNPETFAIYINGAMEIPLISILTGALATASMSELSRKVKAGSLNDALDIFKSIASLSSVILLPALVYFFICADIFMVFLFGDRYSDSANPFRIYLLLIPARLVFFGPVLIAFGKTKTVLFRSILELILTAALGAALVLVFGYLGVAIAIVMVTYFWSVYFNLSQLRGCFGVRIRDLLPYEALFKRFIISISAAPLIAIPQSSGLSNPLMVLAVSSVIYFSAIAIIYFYSKDSDFKNIISFVRKNK